MEMNILLAALAVLSYFTAALPRGQNLHTVRHSVEGKTGDHHELEAGQSIDQIIYQARKDGQSNAGVNKKAAEDLEMEASGEVVLSELDIMYTKEEYDRLQQNELPLESRQANRRHDKNLRTALREKRAATNVEHKYWPDAVIPYVIDEDAVFTTIETDEFNAALADYTKYTCIQWRPKTASDAQYISIEDRSGCWSYIGKQNFESAQPLSLAPRCRSKGVMSHEMMHALGAYHEQSRADRDDFVIIALENVHQAGLSNYRKKSEDEQEVFDVPYDYSSVMHYGAYTFALNYSYPVITTVDKSQQSKIGQRDGLSFQDINLLNHMYKCTDHCPIRNCPKDGFQGKDCKCWCQTGNPDDLMKECDEQGTTRPRPTTTTTAITPVCNRRYSSCQCDLAPQTACSQFAKTMCDTNTGACVCEHGLRLSRGECKIDPRYTTTSQKPTQEPTQRTTQKSSQTQSTTSQRPTTTTPAITPVCNRIYSSCQCDLAPQTACSQFAKTMCDTNTGACVCEHGLRLSRGECKIDLRITATTPKPTQRTTQRTTQKPTQRTTQTTTQRTSQRTTQTTTQKPTQMTTQSPSPDNRCSNKYEQCDTWARRGYCDHQIYSSFMTADCQLSCTCDLSAQSTKQDSDCEDTASNCLNWKSRGFCAESSPYHKFMKSKCKTTCGLCISSISTETCTC